MTETPGSERTLTRVENQETIAVYRAVYNHLLGMAAFADRDGWIDARSGKPIDVAHTEELYDLLEPVWEIVSSGQTSRKSSLFLALSDALGGLLPAARRSRDEFLKRAQEGAGLASFVGEHLEPLENALQLSDEVAVLPTDQVSPLAGEADSPESGSSASAPSVPADHQVAAPLPGVKEPRPPGDADATEAPACHAPTFRRHGQFWDLSWGEKRSGPLGDCAGFALIQKVLQCPNHPRGLSVFEIWHPHAQRLAQVPESQHEAVDRRGRIEIKKELKELDDRIANVREHAGANPALADEALEELGRKRADLESIRAKDTAIGGRSRLVTAGSPQRKAADAARKQLDRAYEVIRDHIPEMVDHLVEFVSLSRGIISYRPHPVTPTWVLE